MGLSFPGPVGEDELIVTFRPPPGLPLREKESLLWSIINELPRGLPAEGPNYFDRMRFPDDSQWDAHYHGPDVAGILAAIQPLLASLEPKFASITTRVNPAR